MRAGNGARLNQIDGLRGLAAAMVVLYHFTTRYDESYIHHASLPLSLPKGFLGVNLFFAISGFVILMTLSKTRAPLDFVISRLSRLYPTYWAAVLISSAVVLLAELPGHSPEPSTIAANLLMFHGLFLVPHVDGVYWSLEVELIFYLWMLALWSFGLLERPMRSFLIWLSLSVALVHVSNALSIRLPWTAEHLGLLIWIPWFSIGVATYASTSRDGERGLAVAVIVLAIIQIALSAGYLEATWAVLVALILRLAAEGRVAALSARPVALIGALSYPLYLLHENIGFSVMLHAERGGAPPMLSVGLAIVVAIALAYALHMAIELPAMHLIRAWYARWRIARGSHGAGRPMLAWGAASISTLSIAALAMQLLNRVDDGSGPRQASAIDTAPAAAASAVICTRVSMRADWWLFTDDVPMAGAHSIDTYEDASPVTHSGLPCTAVRSPRGLAAMLLEHSQPEPALLPGLLVSTSSDTPGEAWPIANESGAFLPSTAPSASAGAGTPPTAILWQRTGWALARDLTADQYEEELFDHVRELRRAGLTAPVLVARDAICRGDPFGVISRSQQRIPHIAEAARLGILAGPNIDGDRKAAAARSDCMLVAAERRRAATLWAESLDGRAASPYSR